MERGESLGVSPGLGEDSQIDIVNLTFSVDQIDVVFNVHAGNDLSGDAVDLLDGELGSGDGVGLAGLLDKLFSGKVEEFLDGGVKGHELVNILLSGTTGDGSKGADESESENKEESLH